MIAIIITLAPFTCYHDSIKYAYGLDTFLYVDRLLFLARICRRRVGNVPDFWKRYKMREKDREIRSAKKNKVEESSRFFSSFNAPLAFPRSSSHPFPLLYYYFSNSKVGPTRRSCGFYGCMSNCRCRAATGEGIGW